MMKVKFYGPLKNPSDDVDDKCGRDKIIHFSAVGKNQRWFRVGGDKIPKCQVKIGPSMNSKEVRQKWTITQTHVLIGGHRQMYKVHSYPAHLFGAFPLAQNLSYTFDFSQMTLVDKNCDHFCKNFPSLEHSGLRSKVSNISNGTLLIAKLAQDEEKIRRMNIFPSFEASHTHSQPQSTSPPLFHAWLPPIWAAP